MLNITRWEIDGVFGVRCEICPHWGSSSYSAREVNHDARLHEAWHQEQILAGLSPLERLCFDNVQAGIIEER